MSVTDTYRMKGNVGPVHDRLNPRFLSRGRFSSQCAFHPAGTVSTFSTLGAGNRSVTFEKAPSYLSTHAWPGVAQDVKRMLPHAKVIFTICDPTPRLYVQL